MAFWNFPTGHLYEHIILLSNEAMLSRDGAVVVRTGDHTGRSPNDKFIVKESTSAKDICWRGILRLQHI